MIQKQFIEHAIQIVKADSQVLGLAVAGSYINNEMDDYSDVDLVLITADKIAPDIVRMEAYAKSFGAYLHGFTGEHVGDPRLLICLYDAPLLHVDIKFLTLAEFEHRVENPVIVFDREHALATVLRNTTADWPGVDYQWLEDRFWTWVHYATLKLGRGEHFEVLDFLAFVRNTVTAPLLQIKHGNLPRGLRKVEFNIDGTDLDTLASTVAQYSPQSLFRALENTIELYRDLRAELFPPSMTKRTNVEEEVIKYFVHVRSVRLNQ